MKKHWQDEYRNLNLYGGEIQLISDDEDMITITYPDGMLIDVGLKDSIYYITVISSDDMDGWQSPLSEIAVSEKTVLPQPIQETINTFRKKEWY